jgi:hypothetical protein
MARPPAKIDLDEVRKARLYSLHGREIVAFFGIAPR